MRASSALAVFAVLAAATTVVTAADFDVMFDASSGSYNVTLGGKPYLQSGDTFFRADGKTFKVSDGSLKLASSGSAKGSDKLGSFTGHALTWSSTGGHTFKSSIKVYDSFALFGQEFPQGATATGTGDRDLTISGFPVFKLLSNPTDLGFVAYTGDMVGDNSQYGRVGHDSIPGGVKGGPVVMFPADLTDSLVLSSASQFMAMSHSYNSSTGELAYGIMGNVTELPPSYTCDFIVHAGTGVNLAMQAWGKTLRTRYGKDMAFKARDFTLQYLGYSTDNGAYYYYTTEPNKTYQDTMIDVANYASEAGIPYRWQLLDSWWYPKGKDDGVIEWVADPTVFPGGMDYVYNKTGWLIQGHNRYWSSETSYAKQNGGRFDFLFSTDDKYQYGLPLTQDFWDYLMHSSKQWGLTTYEQDWLDDEFDRVTQLNTNVTLGRTWLLQMGTAAAANSLAIQYCMSHCRHIMQSLEIPAVTQARASGDYHPGNEQWRVGVTSIFANAVGIAPTKDNYWSTTVQPGSAHYPTATEPYNRLEAAVSTLSSGPVAPSDMVGHSNVSLIMRSCMSDGTLLQPDSPATVVDPYFLSKSGMGDGPDGEVQSASSMVGGALYSQVLVAALDDSWNLPLSAIGYAASESLVAFETNTTSNVTKMSGSDKLTAHACGKSDFQLYSVAPVLPSGYAILGETSKWVPVNNKRFNDVEDTGNSLTVTLRGFPGETTAIDFFSHVDGRISSVVCTFGQSSAATIRMPAATCVSY